MEFSGRKRLFILLIQLVIIKIVVCPRAVLNANKEDSHPMTTTILDGRTPPVLARYIDYYHGAGASPCSSSICIMLWSMRKASRRSCISRANKNPRLGAGTPKRRTRQKVCSHSALLLYQNRGKSSGQPKIEKATGSRHQTLPATAYRAAQREVALPSHGGWQAH